MNKGTDVNQVSVNRIPCFPLLPSLLAEQKNNTRID